MNHVITLARKKDPEALMSSVRTTTIFCRGRESNWRCQSVVRLVLTGRQGTNLSGKELLRDDGSETTEKVTLSVAV